MSYKIEPVKKALYIDNKPYKKMQLHESKKRTNIKFRDIFLKEMKKWLKQDF